MVVMCCTETMTGRTMVINSGRYFPLTLPTAVIQAINIKPAHSNHGRHPSVPTAG
jgi:hypothetical protein